MNTAGDNNDNNKYSGEITSSTKKSTSCELTNVDTITEDIDSVAIQDDKSTCVNCGKEGSSNDLKACTACKLVKYCNRDCQIAHRPQHKKECKKRAAELRDEKLFKQPPQLEDDCPICMIRLPTLGSGCVYMACCGKSICRGCTWAFQLRALKAGRSREDDLCPFCRTPPPNSPDEAIKRYEKGSKMKNASAMHQLGCFHNQGQFGRYGLPQNHAKALKLCHRAGELGHSGAYNNIGSAYNRGLGVEVDMKKAIHYYELAAVGGIQMQGII